MAPTGGGASPNGSPRTGSSRPWTPRRGTPTRRSTAGQDGFKAHLAVEPDTGIITDCALTKASGVDSHDAVVGIGLLDAEPEPVTALGDSAYGTGDARAALAEAEHSAVIKPPPLRPPVPGGFTLDDFIINPAQTDVTCPAGHTRPITASRSITFGALCRGCPLRSRCTTAKNGRSLTLHEHEQLLRAARRQAETPQFRNIYRRHRPMVERSIAWLVRGNRKVRYRGTMKNDRWLHHRAAALNRRRLVTLGLDHNGTTWTLTPAFS
jgi:Transposase DDE domain